MVVVEVADGGMGVAEVGAGPLPGGGFMGLGLGMEVEACEEVDAGARTQRQLAEGPAREALGHRPPGVAVAGEADEVKAAMRPELCSIILGFINPAL